MRSSFLLGYDFYMFYTEGIRLPLYAPIGHTICVGGSGSGKSTALLYWLYKMKKSGVSLDLYIMDFKASHEFEGITEHYAEFEACYEQIVSFYKMFTSLSEGGDGTIKILLIDEVSGMLTHFGMTKEGKAKADEIRQIMSSILSLGRSKGVYCWLCMQRFSASIFPSASGSVDNMMVSVAFGRLTVESRKSLFAGEHFEGEETLVFGQGKGIVLIDGQTLCSVIIPQVSKKKVLRLLQEMR